MTNRSTIVPNAWLLIAVGFSLVASAQDRNAQDREKTRVKLALSDRAQPAQPPSGVLAALTGSVELNVRQARSGGIGADVTITNTGGASVSIFDPRAYSHLEVQTEDGWPVDVPSTVGVDPRINRAPRTGEPRHRQPQVVELAANQPHVFTLRVTEAYPIQKRPADVWGQPGADRQGSQGTPGPLPPGKYKVRVVSTLVIAGVPEGGEPNSRAFVSPFVELTLEP